MHPAKRDRFSAGPRPAQWKAVLPARTRIFQAVIPVAAGVPPGAATGAAIAPSVHGLAGILAGVGAAALVAIAIAAIFWAMSITMLLRSIGARAAYPGVPGIQHLEVVVEVNCARTGLKPPRIWVVNADIPNALALGVSPGNGRLVVTTGLLSQLDPMELEAVTAHELLHIGSGEAVTATLLAAFLLPVARLWSGSGRLVYRLLGRGRELAADRRAMSLTCYPPAMISALEKMARRADATTGLLHGAATVTCWIWTVPAGPLPPPQDEPDHPFVRLAALAEL